TTPAVTRPPEPAIQPAAMSPTTGNLTWEYGPGITTPDLQPPLSWSVRFRAPKAGELAVRVRILDSAGAICFESAEFAIQGGLSVTAGAFYNVDRRSGWRVGPTSTYYRNLCGEDFPAAFVQ